MSEAEVPNLVIQPALPESDPELLEWLLDDGSTAETAALQGQLFEACQLGQRVGAVWANVSAGRVACLIGPRSSGPHAAEVGVRLIQHATGFLAGQGTRVIQAILPIDQQSQIDVYKTADFQHVIELDYLVSPLEKLDLSPGDRQSRQLNFVPYSSAVADRLQRVVVQTYEASQDCPALNCIRDAQDVLAGYRAMGVYADERWLLLQYSGRDVGCLILTDHPAENQMELIYLGIVPEFRGRGFGLTATRRAQTLARRAGRPQLILAVDSTNAPAQTVYHNAGFIRWDRKKVVLRFF